MAETFLVVYPAYDKNITTTPKKLQVSTLGLTKFSNSAATAGFELQSGALKNAKWCLLQAESLEEAERAVRSEPLGGNRHGKCFLVKEASVTEAA